MMKRNIYCMYAMALLQGMVFYGPVATLYRQAAGISIFQITIIESISVALMILLEVPWGRLADRIGYRRTIVICSSLYAISKVIFWRASSFAAFLSERVLLSVVYAGLSGVDVTVLYLSCEKGESQRVFGIYNDLQQAGLLLATVVHGLWIGENYRLAGFCTVVTYGLAALLAFGLREVKAEKRTAVPMNRSAFRAFLSNGKLLLLVFSIALLNETHQTVTVFLSQLKYVEVGMGARAISVAFLVVTLGGLLGRWSDSLTQRFGEKQFGTILFLTAAGACALLAWIRLALLAVLGVLLLRICFTLFQPLQTQLQSQTVTVDDRATALSLNAIIMDTVAVLTNLCFGKIAGSNLSAAMLFGTILCILGLGLYQKSLAS